MRAASSSSSKAAVLAGMVTVVCGVTESPRRHPAALPASSSEDVTSSRAVMKDSALDSGPMVLPEVLRPFMLGRGIDLVWLEGCGGVTSGVGGLRWSGGVAGGRFATMLGSLTLSSVLVGLGAAAERLLEEALDCAGGVGGRSGPVPILRSWCFKGCEIMMG